eukprot:5895016-Amphidinium_carterae.1
MSANWRVWLERTSPYLRRLRGQSAAARGCIAMVATDCSSQCQMACSTPPSSPQSAQTFSSLAR